MVVRDEADIIAQSVAHHLGWADSVHILDTGSTDGTRAILAEMARVEPWLHLHLPEPVFYAEGILGHVFEQARSTFRDGDWVARPDADEFFDRSPREFVRDRLEWGEALVRATMFEFVITKSDASVWEDGRETPADRERPIGERRRRYYVSHYPETRLFRFRRGMTWPSGWMLPRAPGLMAYERIPLRHYRSRDLGQVRKRCALRRALRELSGQSLVDHWSLDWKSFVWPDDARQVRTLGAGERLPEFPSKRMAAGTWARIREQAMYRMGGGRMSDLLRGRGDRPFEPRAIPPEVQLRLAECWREADVREMPAQPAQRASRAAPM